MVMWIYRIKIAYDKTALGSCELDYRPYSYKVPTIWTDFLRTVKIGRRRLWDLADYSSGVSQTKTTFLMH